jgi:hypothetical protein
MADTGVDAMDGWLDDTLLWNVFGLCGLVSAALVVVSADPHRLEQYSSGPTASGLPVQPDATLHSGALHSGNAQDVRSRNAAGRLQSTHGKSTSSCGPVVLG